MALMIPKRSEAQLRRLKSQAEARVYRKCRDDLPGDVCVIHSLDTLLPAKKGAPLRQGEADFTILWPGLGMLVLEIKGGGVAFDPMSGEWISEDRYGSIHEIPDPFKQARKRLNDLRAYITTHAQWRKLGAPNLSAGYAALFPDLDDIVPLKGPDRPLAIIGGRRDVQELGRWIKGVFSHYRPKNNPWPYDSKMHKVAMETLTAPFSLKPKLGAVFADEDEQRGYWTEEQWQGLKRLRSNRRVLVRGGAGTGKTLLGMRWAQEVARAGERVLFLCFNRPLADHLRREVEAFLSKSGLPSTSLTVTTFSAFCSWWAGVAKGEIGKDYVIEAREGYPGEDEELIILPMALALALEDHPLPYDVLVVDEAQDFSDEFWGALDPLLEEMRYAIFHDPNQALYQRSIPPDAQAIYDLTQNCRSTGQLHEAGLPFYKGPPDLEGPALQGEEIRVETADGLPAQAARIKELLKGLVKEQGLKSEDIVLLLADSQVQKQACTALESLGWPSKLKLSIREHWKPGHVTVDTVKRFKGLEALVVILWLNGPIARDRDRELLYVALSRPRSLLILVGADGACTEVTEACNL